MYIPKAFIALAAALEHCKLHFKSLVIQMPKSCSSADVSSFTCVPALESRHVVLSEWPICSTLHLSHLNLSNHFFVQSCCLLQFDGIFYLLNSASYLYDVCGQFCPLLVSRVAVEPLLDQRVCQLVVHLVS